MKPSAKYGKAYHFHVPNKLSMNEKQPLHYSWKILNSPGFWALRLLYIELIFIKISVIYRTVRHLRNTCNPEVEAIQ